MHGPRAGLLVEHAILLLSEKLPAAHRHTDSNSSSEALTQQQLLSTTVCSNRNGATVKMGGWPADHFVSSTTHRHQHTSQSR
jgi:hypothetical protein